MGAYVLGFASRIHKGKLGLCYYLLRKAWFFINI